MKALQLILLLSISPFLILAQDLNMDGYIEEYLQEHMEELQLSQQDFIDYSIYRQYFSVSTELIHIFD